MRRAKAVRGAKREYMYTQFLQTSARQWGTSNNMNTPPNPPSPADEEALARSIAKLQKRVILQMKTKFPGLPY